MRKILKKAVQMQAWRLGDRSPMEKKLIMAHKLHRQNDGTYLVYSSEVRKRISGEIAHEGDYIKVDVDGNPYPIEKTKFENSHIHLEGDFYEQKATPLDAWETGTASDDVIDYLIKHGLLEINVEDTDRYYHAKVWGTDLYQSQDALVVIYNVECDPNGNIQNVNFNLLSRAAFENTYTYI